MSKTLEITIFPAKDLQCSLKNIICLLEKAGWCTADYNGKITVWNEDSSEWESHNGSLGEFAQNNALTWFYAYSGLHIIKVCTNGSNSFSIVPEAYIQMITCTNGKYFDYNWYYEHLIAAFNKGKTIVERVIFEEY